MTDGVPLELAAKLAPPLPLASPRRVERGDGKRRGGKKRKKFTPKVDVAFLSGVNFADILTPLVLKMQLSPRGGKRFVKPPLTRHLLGAVRPFPSEARGSDARNQPVHDADPPVDQKTRINAASVLFFLAARLWESDGL